jgi:hypothetical protein
MYLVLHKKEKKFSIWKSPIFRPPESLIWSWDHEMDMGNETLSGGNATSNETNSTTSGDAAPAAPAAPAAAPAAPAAGGAAPADSGNSTNKTNASKKPKKKAQKKKKLPEPKAGDDSDDEAEGVDLSWDIDEEEDYEGLEFREKVNKASQMYELPGGYMHVKWHS